MGGACGKIGEACCGDVGCTAPFSLCNGNNQCVACGGLGQPCCESRAGGGRFCGEPFACDRNSQHCALCGGAGQPCCAGEVCATGHTCNATTNVCN